MPRSQADRAFGFRSQGLVRILLAADIEEVKKALEVLGLELAEGEPGVLDLFKDLFDELFGPVFLIRELTKAILDKLFGPTGTLPQKVSDLDREIVFLQREADRVSRVISAIDRAVGEGNITPENLIRQLNQIVSTPLRVVRRGILNSVERLDTIGADLQGISNESEVFQKKLAVEQAKEDAAREAFEGRIRAREGAPRTTTTI